jgi:hypothetical protein
MMTSTVGSTRRVRIVASNRAVAGVPPRTEESTLHLTIFRGDPRRHAAAFSFVVTRTLDRPVTCWKGPAVALGALPCGGQLWWAATELPFPPPDLPTRDVVLGWTDTPSMSLGMETRTALRLSGAP